MKAEECFRTIMYAKDVETGDASLPFAMALARRQHASLIVVHALSSGDRSPMRMESARAWLIRSLPPSVESVLDAEPIHRCVPRLVRACRCDLIMASGADAHRLLRVAEDLPCPVMILRGLSSAVAVAGNS